MPSTPTSRRCNREAQWVPASVRRKYKARALSGVSLLDKSPNVPKEWRQLLHTYMGAGGTIDVNERLDWRGRKMKSPLAIIFPALWRGEALAALGFDPADPDVGRMRGFGPVPAAVAKYVNRVWRDAAARGRDT